ncbi:MAG: RNA polymerase sigma factor, partial [Pseudomonadota bacterium]
SKVSSWIFSIAYRMCLRVIKRESHRGNVLQILRLQPRTDSAEFESQLTDADLLARAMTTLSASHRMALTLAYYEGYSTEEIGRIAGCPTGTVKTRLHHARQKLRHYIEQHAS